MLFLEGAEEGCLRQSKTSKRLSEDFKTLYCITKEQIKKIKLHLPTKTLNLRQKLPIQGGNLVIIEKA